MKAIKRILLFFGLSIFTLSCSKDELQKETQIEPSIVGKWNYLKIDITNDGIENFVDYTQDDASCSSDYYYFYANANFEDVSYVSDTSPCEATFFAGTWAKNGSNVVLDLGADGLHNVEIIQLTETQLKLKWSNSYSIILVK